MRGKRLGWFKKHGVSFDVDAQAFIDAVGTLSETQQDAVNTLVVGLKTDSLWTKMKAIYPFVGGTATTHKFNLKDPRDLDAAFRLTFNSSISHTSNGITSVSNGYCDTHVNTSTDLSQDDVHSSIYSRTDLVDPSQDYGCAEGTSVFATYTRTTGDLILARVNNNNFAGGSISDSLGLTTASRTSSTQARLYRNGSVSGVDSTVSSVTPPNYNVYICTLNLEGANVTPSVHRNYAFFSLGDGLTNLNVSNLYTLVQAYQTTLGRQV